MTLWQGRFGEEGPAEELLAYTVSLPYDRRLARDDVVGSRAHVRGLAAAGDPLRRRGQDPAGRPRPGRRRAGDATPWSSSPATRTCTPPSNGGSPRSPARSGPGCTPAAAATTRSPPTCGCSPSGSCWRWPTASRISRRCSSQRARAAEDAYLPGYTHLQRAQPVLLAHHLLAHGWALARDVDRLLDTRRRLDVSPLGAGALAGSSLPLDPDRVAAELGFAARFENSLDAVSDRDFVAEALFDLALIGVHLSRIGEEMVLWSSEEFGFVDLRRRLRHRQLHAAAEKEPGHRRAGPGPVRPAHRPSDRPAGHPQGPAAGVQPGPAGGQGAVLRRPRSGHRWAAGPDRAAVDA